LQYLSCPKCAKTHLQAYAISKIFPGGYTPGPPFKRGREGEVGRGGRGEEREGGVGKEGWEREGGRGEEGREGGREGKGIGMELVLCPRKKKQKSAPMINRTLNMLSRHIIS
jgi:hypothetical protein